MGSSSDDWARAVAERIQAKAAKELEAARVASLTRDIVALEMPRVWEELISEFKKCCDSYNAQLCPERRLMLQRTNPDFFIIRPDGGEQIIEGRYSPDTKHIRMQTASEIELFAPNVNPGTRSLALVSRNGNRTTDVQTIARTSIEVGLDL